MFGSKKVCGKALDRKRRGRRDDQLAALADKGPHRAKEEAVIGNMFQDIGTKNHVKLAPLQGGTFVQSLGIMRVEFEIRHHFPQFLDTLHVDVHTNNRPGGFLEALMQKSPLIHTFARKGVIGTTDMEHTFALDEGEEPGITFYLP